MKKLVSALFLILLCNQPVVSSETKSFKLEVNDDDQVTLTKGIVPTKMNTLSSLRLIIDMVGDSSRVGDDHYVKFNRGNYKFMQEETKYNHCFLLESVQYQCTHINIHTRKNLEGDWKEVKDKQDLSIKYQSFFKYTTHPSSFDEPEKVPVKLQTEFFPKDKMFRFIIKPTEKDLEDACFQIFYQKLKK